LHEIRTAAGTSVETHLYQRRDETTVVRKFDAEGSDRKFKLVETSDPIKLSDAPKARAEQDRLIKSGNQGALVLEGKKANSCASHGCDLGKAGGAEGLPENRSEWREWVYEKTEPKKD
jgi:hypothetical protein